MPGLEPGTSSLPRKCSTAELHWQLFRFRAEDEAQTRDPQLGRLMLYQLSYFRRTLLYPAGGNGRFCGRGWIRTTEGESQQIYSLPHLATLEHALIVPISKIYVFNLVEPLVGFEPTTPRLQITCSGQLS